MHRAKSAGKLVIATHNPGKLAEMRELLGAARHRGRLGRRTRPRRTRGDRQDFLANARIKAVAAAQAARLPAFADDSGLVVDALDGAPGIYSRALGRPEQGFQRGDGADRAAACASAARRRRTSARAHFVSALCVAWPDDHLEEVEARADGTLVWPPRGTAGFGYDPMFQPDGLRAPSAR